MLCIVAMCNITYIIIIYMNYYNILDIRKDADSASIKRAFRKKAMQYHPDRNQGDKNAEKKFKEINEAYEVLKDDNKRAAYDNYGTTNFQNNNAFHERTGGFDDLSDVFGDIFGDFMGGTRRSHAQENQDSRGANFKYNTTITLEEAYNGLKRVIQFIALCPCHFCDAKGSKDNIANKQCSSCNGTGKERIQQGFFMIEKMCSVCKGTRTVINNPCVHCKGQGRIQKEKKIAVSIPAGIDNNARIRLSGEGEAGIRGSKAGDLYIEVNVEQHKFYERQKNNLYCTVPIKMVTAILGGEIEIPTLNGKIVKVSIPSETQPGDKLRLKNKGMSVIRSVRYGDLYININVELPKKISKKQKELLEEFNALNQHGSNPETESFFSKVRNFVTDISK